jgi:hypothetical protein
MAIADAGLEQAESDTDALMVVVGIMSTIEGKSVEGQPEMFCPRLDESQNKSTAAPVKAGCYTMS